MYSFIYERKRKRIINDEMPRAKQNPKSSEKKVAAVKKRKTKPGSVARKEVAIYSKTTTPLLSKRPFRRIVMKHLVKHFEKLTGMNCEPGKDIRIQMSALEAMQISTEDFVQRLIQHAMDNVRHFKRQRLRVVDIEHIYRLKFPSIVGGTNPKSEPRTTKNSVEGRPVTK